MFRKDSRCSSKIRKRDIPYTSLEYYHYAEVLGRLQFKTRFFSYTYLKAKDQNALLKLKYLHTHMRTHTHICLYIIWQSLGIYIQLHRPMLVTTFHAFSHKCLLCPWRYLYILVGKGPVTCDLKVRTHLKSTISIIYVHHIPTAEDALQHAVFIYDEICDSENNIC